MRQTGGDSTDDGCPVVRATVAISSLPGGVRRLRRTMCTLHYRRFSGGGRAFGSEYSGICSSESWIGFTYGRSHDSGPF